MKFVNQEWKKVSHDVLRTASYDLDYFGQSSRHVNRAKFAILTVRKMTI